MNENFINDPSISLPKTGEALEKKNEHTSCDGPPMIKNRLPTAKTITTKNLRGAPYADIRDFAVILRR